MEPPDGPETFGFESGDALELVNTVIEFALSKAGGTSVSSGRWKRLFQRVRKIPTPRLAGVIRRITKDLSSGERIDGREDFGEYKPKAYAQDAQEGQRHRVYC